MSAALSTTRPTAALAVGKRAPFQAGAALPARPASAAAARRRTARGAPLAVSARAAKAAKGQAYICVDCGYIYDGSEGPFDKLPSSYRCPVCSAPKRRFKAYDGGAGRNDAKSMAARYDAMQRGGKAGGGDVNSGAFLAVGLAAAAGLAGLWFYLSSQYN